MRYIIVGAGAVGGVIGGRLHASGHRVVLVARGENYSVLRERGLEVRTPTGTSVHAVPVVRSSDSFPLSPDDVLVFAMKTQDTAAALQQWAERPLVNREEASDVLPVICAQNGVANERLALRHFRHVYGMSVWFPATHLEPGTVEAAEENFTGAVHLGRYPTGVDDLVEQVGDDLRKSTFQVHLQPDIMYWKYAKLLNNLGNALEALIGPLESEQAVELFERAKEEGVRVLRAADIAYANSGEQREMLRLRAESQAHNPVLRKGGSSWQSLARGTRSVEADYLNGEIVLLGRELGIPTPVNTLLQREANRAARESRPPAALPLSALLSRID